jgi:hypothetical protein
MTVRGNLRVEGRATQTKQLAGILPSPRAPPYIAIKALAHTTISIRRYTTTLLPPPRSVDTFETRNSRMWTLAASSLRVPFTVCKFHDGSAVPSNFAAQLPRSRVAVGK